MLADKVRIDVSGQLDFGGFKSIQCRSSTIGVRITRQAQGHLFNNLAVLTRSKVTFSASSGTESFFTLSIGREGKKKHPYYMPPGIVQLISNPGRLLETIGEVLYRAGRMNLKCSKLPESRKASQTQWEVVRFASIRLGSCLFDSKCV